MGEGGERDYALLDLSVEESVRKNRVRKGKRRRKERKNKNKKESSIFLIFMEKFSSTFYEEMGESVCESF